MAMASQGHSGAFPRSSIQPVRKPILRPKVRSTYSMMPPEMGIAAVSSPKHMPMGTRKNAPMAKAIIAGIGPPPSTIQSPTSKTQPVPMMAPNPMVKKLKSVSSFFIPPEVEVLLSAIPPPLRSINTQVVRPRKIFVPKRFPGEEEWVEPAASGVRTRASGDADANQNAVSELTSCRS